MFTTRNKSFSTALDVESVSRTLDTITDRTCLAMASQGECEPLLSFFLFHLPAPMLSLKPRTAIAMSANCERRLHSIANGPIGDEKLFLRDFHVSNLGRVEATYLCTNKDHDMITQVRKSMRPPILIFDWETIGWFGTICR